MKLKKYFSYLLLFTVTVFGLPSVESQKLGAVGFTHSERVEVPFEFLAISTIYSDLSEDSLIGISLEPDRLSLFSKASQQYIEIAYDLPSVDWNLISSMDEAIQRIQETAASIPDELLLEKIKGSNTTLAIIGDHESTIAQLIEAITNQKLTLENLNHFISTFDWQQLNHSSTDQILFVDAVRMKSLMEIYAISEIQYRSTEAEFPTNDSFFDWPDTIASLYFFYGSGLTISPVSNQNPTKGYVVALDGHSHIVSASEFFAGPSGNEAGREMIKEYLKLHSKQFLMPHIYFGIWHDTERDLIFLDLSEVVQDLDEAIQLAIERDQIAIYDLSTGTVIETHGSGGVSKNALSYTFFTLNIW